MPKRQRSQDSGRQMKKLLTEKVALENNVNYMNNVYRKTNALLFEGAQSALMQCSTSMSCDQDDPVATASSCGSISSLENSQNRDNICTPEKSNVVMTGGTHLCASTRMLLPRSPFSPGDTWNDKGRKVVDKDPRKKLRQLRLDSLWANTSEVDFSPSLQDISQDNNPFSNENISQDSKVNLDLDLKTDIERDFGEHFDIDMGEDFGDEIGFFETAGDK